MKGTWKASGKNVKVIPVWFSIKALGHNLPMCLCKSSCTYTSYKRENYKI